MYMKEALSFLQQNNTAAITTVYRNIPFLSTIYYVVDEDFNFYFLTKRGTDKYLNLTLNSNVAVVVGTGPKQISVQARGNAEILDGKEKGLVIKKIIEMVEKKEIKKIPIKEMNRFSPNGNILNTEVVVKVVPQQLIFMNLDDKSYPESISKEYHTILPKQ